MPPEARDDEDVLVVTRELLPDVLRVDARCDPGFDPGFDAGFDAGFDEEPEVVFEVRRPFAP